MSLAFIDLTVIVAVMAAVTWMGHRLSGSIRSRRGFFEGDGTLPWWAVSASVVATLVSAVTFVSVPANVFAPGGNLNYFQVILGLALGKIAVAALLARPFYLSQGIRSSYEYIGARLDRPSGELSMYLGLVLNVINSGVKLLTASLVLDVITGWGLAGSGAFVVLVSIVWGALAGIKTVIWTDFLLFVLFSVSALYLVGFVVFNVELSMTAAFAELDARAKLVLFDFSTDTSKSYTIWAAVIGGIALNIAQGSTQGTWQRVRACRSVGDAYKAYGFAAAFYVVHLIILAVGLSLVVFYSERAIEPDVAAALIEQPDRILPHFVVSEIPVGLSGLIIAGIFAAAISTLDSALAEVCDLSITHIYAVIVKAKTEAHYLLVSRCLMGFWGLVFLMLALFFARYSAEGLLNLTFKLPNYVYGAIFGTIVLARMGVGRLSTILAGIAVATTVTLALSANDIAFFYWCPVAGLAMLITVLVLERASSRWRGCDWRGVVTAPVT